MKFKGVVTICTVYHGQDCIYRNESVGTWLSMRTYRVQRVAHEIARVAHLLQRLAVGGIEVAAERETLDAERQRLKRCAHLVKNESEIERQTGKEWEEFRKRDDHDTIARHNKLKR
jgi:hypothetical protein